MSKAFVVAGSPTATAPWGISPSDGDRVIAADRGAEHARAWGWPVHLLVGDLDSLAPSAVEYEAARGTPVVRVPAAKDQTDTELALDYALREEPVAIVICAALGGRVDHLLANVLLLARPDLSSRDVSITDGPDTVRLLSVPNDASVAGLELPGRRGDLLTLLPLQGAAAGITTSGLLYPLNDETLPVGSARGVSNIFSGDRARITLRAGSLLVLHHALEQPR